MAWTEKSLPDIDTDITKKQKVVFLHSALKSTKNYSLVDCMLDMISSSVTQKNHTIFNLHYNIESLFETENKTTLDMKSFEDSL